MIKFAICDDEKIMAENIKSKIIDYLKDKTEFKIDLYYQGHELLDNYDFNYDFIFLDIKLLDSNGFDIAEEIKNKDEEVKIIFITSSEEYVYKGYEINIFRYILKDRLDIELKKVLDDILLLKTNEKKKHIVIKSNKVNIQLAVDDIMYIYSDLRKLNFITKDNMYQIYGKLSEYEKILSSDNFIRSHNGYLVNMDYIKTFTANFIILNNDDKVPVSKKYSENVKRTILEREIL